MNSPPQVILEGLPNDNIRRVAWWYCVLRKNPPAPSEPKVEICFREIRLDNTLGNTFSHYHVGITNLGQIPLGTIWRGRNRVGKLDFVDEIFQLNFDDGGWEFADAWGKIGENHRIIPPFSYELSDKTRHPPTKVVAFHFTSTPFGLIIPCLEVFSRLYGRSQYIKRILLTTPLDGAIEKLIVPDVEEAPANTWQVTLDKHCYDGDAVFLAHLRHDPLTEKRVRLIWGQTEGAQNTTGDIQVFPEIGPWHDGPAQLKVKGVWLDKDKTRFLGLHILKWSEPGGVDIYLDRQNTNLVTGPLKKLKNKTTWPKINRKRPKEHKEITLKYSEEPGTKLTAKELFDEPCEVLGRKRKVTKIVREQQGDREKCATIQHDSANQCSGGEAHGEKKDVTEASIHAPEKIESLGTLKDVWDALVRLAAEPEYGIESIASISGNGEIHNYTNPTLFKFYDFRLDYKLTIPKQRWLLLDTERSNSTRNSRSILLIRVKTKLGAGYLVEFQRRTKINKNGTHEETEHYKGFAFQMERENDLPNWLPIFFESLARAEGVLDRTKKCWPIIAKTFTHRYAKDGSLKKSVLNGLTKIGLI